MQKNILIEKTIGIHRASPELFFDKEGIILSYLRSKFNELFIHSRGNELRVKGEETALLYFEKEVQKVENYLVRNSDLSSEDLNRIFSRFQRNQVQKDSLPSAQYPVLFYGMESKAVKPKTVNQQELVKQCEDNDLVFALGPAGTGKTYVAVALAVKALKNREIRRIVLTRPAVEAGEKIGFLPGDIQNKIDPYLRPLYDALREMIPEETFSKYLENFTLEIAPMAFMRGRTFNNCFVILDEAQNATKVQLKMLLTRMGVNSKIIITGDLSQIDLPSKMQSGLRYSVDILKDIEGIGVVRFGKEDVVRHRLVRQIISAFEKDDKADV